MTTMALALAMCLLLLPAMGEAVTSIHEVLLGSMVVLPFTESTLASTLQVLAGTICARVTAVSPLFVI